MDEVASSGEQSKGASLSPEAGSSFEEKRESEGEIRRIIPCLDIKDGRVVKGIRFASLRDAGDPVEQALSYQQQGADELAFLDISATLEGRQSLIPLLQIVSTQLRIPIVVGGGVRSLDDAAALVDAGASKILLSSAALSTPQLIDDLARRFGGQSVVVGIDAKAKAEAEAEAPEAGDEVRGSERNDEAAQGPKFGVWSHGASRPTGKDAVAWAREVAERGAGEILLTSIDRDGTRSGFDLALTQAVVATSNARVIASGGAGKLEDFAEVFIRAGASAALAASLFHFGELSVAEVKTHCLSVGLNMHVPEKGGWRGI